MKYTYKLYEVSAFISHQIAQTHHKVLGNPASICIVDQLPHLAIMQQVGIQLASPMTVFLEPITNKPFTYKIRYVSPNGTFVNLCGHATVAATKALSDLLHFKEGKMTFLLDEQFQVNPHNAVEAIVEKDYITLVFPALKITKQLDRLLKAKISDALKVDKEQIKEIYRGELGDYLIRLDTAKTLRSLQPNMEKLKTLFLEKKYTYRALLVTALSDEMIYDFETRVFGIGLGIPEDIACGSANCAVAPYWKNQLGKASMSMLYPYKMHETTYAGGVQLIRCQEDQVHISSKSKIIKSYDLMVLYQESSLLSPHL